MDETKDPSGIKQMMLNKLAHRNTVEQVVLCPVCEREFCKALYDWQFIYCDNCRTYFEKHTGEKIECDRPPKRYWVRDSDNWIYSHSAGR